MLKKYKMMFSPHNKILLYINYFLIFFYCFSSVFFDRPGLTIIPNGTLVLLFLISGIEIFIFRIKIFSPFFIYLVSILFLSVVSNLVMGIFSYNFIILICISASVYVQFSVDKDKFFKTFLLCFISGLVFSILFILFDLRNQIFETLSIPANNKFMNIDRMASISVTLISLSAVYLFTYRKFSFLSLFPFIGLLCGTIIVFLTFRLGSIVKTFILLVALTLVSIKKVNVKLYNVLVVALPILSVSLLSVLIFTNAIPRLTEAFAQFFDLKVIYDGSTRERVLMILRDLRMIFMFPFFGGGYYFVANFNFVVSHNFFGDIGIQYGLLCASLFLIFLFLVYAKRKKVDQIYIYFVIHFLISSLFSLFYGMNFSNRLFYFEFGAISFIYSDLIFKFTKPRLVKYKTTDKSKTDYLEIYC